MTDISHFQQLLDAAREQPDPQRLLFVFAAAELPDDATAAQRQRFSAGQGGTLAPLMCVDKAPAELPSFDALRRESQQAGPPWQVVFAAGLGGRNGQPPTAPQIDVALEAMVEAVRTGSFGRFAAYDRNGNLLEFH